MIYVDRDYAGRSYVAFLPIQLPLITETETDVMYCPFCRDLIIQVDTEGMADDEEVSITVKGSLDNVGFDNLASSKLPTTIDADDTTLIVFDGATTPYVKVQAASDLSGVDAVANIQAYFAVMAPSGEAVGEEA